MHIPKTLVWSGTEKPLNLQELFKFHSEYYERIGIKIIDLTPEEILSAVQERWQRRQGTWIDTEADIMRHHRFWEVMKTQPNFHNADTHIIHGLIHPESRAGTIWLRSREDGFFD